MDERWYYAIGLHIRPAPAGQVARISEDQAVAIFRSLWQWHGEDPPAVALMVATSTDDRLDSEPKLSFAATFFTGVLTDRLVWVASAPVAGSLLSQRWWTEAMFYGTGSCSRGPVTATAIIDATTGTILAVVENGAVRIPPSTVER